MIILGVLAGGSITSRYILLWYWATFIVIGAQGVWTWGLSLLLNWGAHTMGAPIFPLVAFWWHWQLFIQFDSSPPHQPVLLVYSTMLGRYCIWPGRALYLVWISPWPVAIGWHLLSSVAILAAGVGVVVAPWHGHYAQLFPAPWKNCSTVVGDFGDCCVGCFKSSVSHH